MNEQLLRYYELGYQAGQSHARSHAKSPQATSQSDDTSTVLALPDELLNHLITGLPIKDLLAVRCVNRRLLDIADAAIQIFFKEYSPRIFPGHSSSFLQSIHGLFGWGVNQYGQLGSPSVRTHNQLSPVAIPFFNNIVIKALRVERDHSIALTVDGRLFQWGRLYSHLDIASTHIQVSPIESPFFKDIVIKAHCQGASHSIALTVDGRLFGWGQNVCGQLGIGSTDSQLSPVEIPFFKQNDIDIKALYTGAAHSIALTVDGRLFGWGLNRWGQLGIGTTDSQLSPVEIPFFKQNDIDIKALYLREGHSIALTVDGRVFGWGANYSGALGIGSSDNQLSPIEITFFKDIVIKALGIGFTHSIALTVDGRLFGWGQNRSGQLGIGSVDNQSTPVEILFFKDIGIKTLWVGREHSFALTVDGRLFGWGDNGSGQLGSRYRHNHSPVEIDFFSRIMRKCRTIGERGLKEACPLPPANTPSAPG